MKDWCGEWATGEEIVRNWATESLRTNVRGATVDYASERNVDPFLAGFSFVTIKT